MRIDEIINILASMSPVFNTIYGEQYEEFMTAINTQFDTIVESDGDAEIIARAGIDNIKKLCSMFVDINLFLLVAKSDSKKIAVFTGASHAYRLLTMIFKKRSNVLVDLSDDLLPFVQPIPV